MKKCTIVMLLLWPIQVFSADYGSILLSKEDIINVASGNIFEINIDQWQPIVGQGINLRLRGIEMPALEGSCDQESKLAADARNFVHKLLIGASSILLTNIDRDENAFRLLADIDIDNVSLGATIVDAELGVPSESILLGENVEQIWCDFNVSELAYNNGTYSGEIVDGIPNGQGSWIGLGGDEYVGSWQDGMWNGEGAYRFGDGEETIGNYKNGLLDGQGAWMHPDGRRYVGDFNDGRRHGIGTYIWPNGHEYEGAFDNDQKHGVGRYTFADGSIIEGEWNNGKPWIAIYMDPEGNELGQYKEGVWYGK